MAGTEVHSEHVFLVEVHIGVHIHPHFPLDLYDIVKFMRSSL